MIATRDLGQVSPACIKARGRPTKALQAPKLQAEPSVVNVGQVKIGEDKSSELHLTNLGMRLLYGTVTTDCDWLLLGDAVGQRVGLAGPGAGDDQQGGAHGRTIGHAMLHGAALLRIERVQICRHESPR